MSKTKTTPAATNPVAEAETPVPTPASTSTKKPVVQETHGDLLDLKLKPLHENFVLPVYATAGASGFDLHAMEDGSAVPGRVTRARLGFATAVPSGYGLLISARSGHGANYGAGVPHGYGLIDSDYRGELFMVLVTARPFFWKAGDRIGQAILVPTPRASFSVVDDLPATARGEGGFGSTGK